MYEKYTIGIGIGIAIAIAIAIGLAIGLGCEMAQQETLAGYGTLCSDYFNLQYGLKVPGTVVIRQAIGR
jgi:hypothetical protein